ncbi:YpfN family protein [Streptomyces coelicoflavus]|uniref:YpfN family protein n=1 Tax=Streptomyces coelicoflavus TaxID=285562 RepID=A0A6N9UFP9_9ACTN|nr:YpfN family protein [Streptomyces coelicoflavus]NEB16507.1 YpfN family protein [Streptomyces coelicoflavus]
MQPHPPPRTPTAKELRPGRHWYLTAVAIAVVLTVLGVVIGVYRFNNLLDAVDTDQQFANGDTVTLRLDPENEQTIWAKYPGVSPGPECDISGPGAPRLTDPGADLFTTYDETWTPVGTTEVTRAGDYTLTCSSRALSRYALGDSEGLISFAVDLIPAVLLALVGITTAAVITLVTAVRRRAHRKHLLAAPPAPPHR